MDRKFLFLFNFSTDLPVDILDVRRDGTSFYIITKAFLWQAVIVHGSGKYSTHRNISAEYSDTPLGPHQSRRRRGTTQELLSWLLVLSTQTLCL